MKTKTIFGSGMTGASIELTVSELYALKQMAGELRAITKDAAKQSSTDASQLSTELVSNFLERILLQAGLSKVESELFAPLTNEEKDQSHTKEEEDLSHS